MNDYRNTKYCQDLRDVIEKKQKFKVETLIEHPRMRNWYKYVQNKNQGKGDFLKIYNNKCVYCGNNVENIGLDDFEIDHYINKSSIDNANIANRIENLVPACKLCNRKKSDFEIKGEYINILNPENNIKEVFFRDGNYRIKISSTYQNDKVIIDFYNKMEFYAELRRLDYLILEMSGLWNSYNDDDPRKDFLGNILYQITQKRNCIIC